MNYIVMETFESYAVLLSEDGQFVKVANFHYEVGETVKNPVILRDYSRTEEAEVKRFMPKKLLIFSSVIAAVALLFLFFLGIGSRYQQPIADASIYMAINPEVRMDLNQEGDVIGVEGLNPDGLQLIENYELTNANRLMVIQDLIDRAIRKGYLAEGGHLDFTIDATDDQFLTYGTEIQSTVNELLEDMTVSLTISSIRDGAMIEPIEEEEPEPDPEPEPEETEPETQYITLEEAKASALDYAGISGANVVYEDVEFDYDDGVPQYELEFYYGGYEYEVDVHAITGIILDYDVDEDD